MRSHYQKFMKRLRRARPNETIRYYMCGEYGDEQISVFFTVRQYGSLEAESNYEDTLRYLKIQCEELLEGYVIEQQQPDIYE